MKQDTYDQADELARLQAENDQLKAQMAELTAQQERKDVRIPQERKRKLPTTNADSKGQLTGESYLNSRREHWRKEIERDPVLRKNKEQTRLRREQEKEQEEQKEQELSLWHWRAVGICVALVVLFFIIAFLAGKYHFDFMYALLPMVPTIGVIIWGDQMRETLEAGKDPWIELIKMILFSAIALVLLYFSFIFIIAVLILLKFLKSK
ncbi:MAG: hypothetical protein J5932_02920 [Prevotella sp.]|nr:hypothetical protein [Prevotella sp.]MBO5615060.1 hypothetical protein [Prevotella sp.]